MQEDSLSQRSPAGESAVTTGIGFLDSTASLVDLLEKREEDKSLNSKKEDRKQVLEGLQQRIDEFQKKAEESEESFRAVKMLIKDEHIDQVVEKAKRVRTEGLKKDAEITALKEKYAHLVKRKQELQQQVQRHTCFPGLMERVVKMTKFKDVELLSGHLEALLHFREQLYQKENEAQEKVSQLRKALQTMEDQHHVMQLHKNNQLSHLNKQLDKTSSEALIWESKWNQIQETAAKKTLLLVQIKMTSLNLYETADVRIEGEESVNMNDTEKQLDMVKAFIQDHDDIVRQLQTLSDRHDDGQKGKGQRRHRGTKHITEQRSKD